MVRQCPIAEWHSPNFLKNNCYAWREPCIAPEGISQLEGLPLNRRLPAIVLFVAAQAACPMSAFAEDFATIIPMKGGGTYYVTARFGDTISGELMVDTGSGYTTINEQTLASLKEGGHAQYVKDVSGILADGSRTTVPVYRVTQVSIGCCCVVQDIEAAVFPDSTRQILGLSALKKVAPFTVSLEPAQLTLSRCQVDPSAMTAVGLTSP